MGTLIQDARERLRTQGGRMTLQRRMVLEALECLGCHPTAEELYDVVRQRDPSINLSTVYRTLRWLEQEGLISARRFDEGSRQERFDPGLPSQHHHFMCTACNRVIEFDDDLIETIRVRFEEQSGAGVRTTSVVFYGLCPGCRQPVTSALVPHQETVQ
jgi:Fe2+ or Zn2+ uptake regulation protein